MYSDSLWYDKYQHTFMLPILIDVTTLSPTATEPPFNECTMGTHNCENGATCVDTADSFSCTCAPGFTGSACEQGMVVRLLVLLVY